MTELWPTFLRPWWLLALPAAAWLIVYLRRQQSRTGRWQQLLPVAFQQVLLVKAHGRSARWRWLLLACGWTLAIVALAGPSWQRYEQPARKPFAPLVIMLELSPNMLANDGTPTRLQQAKHKILDLIQARDGAQTAIVVFAGSAHTLVPLSQDIATTRNLLDALKPSIMPVSGLRVDLALHQALQLAEHGAQGAADFLLLSTELDPKAKQAISQFRARERLRILGVGTAQGAPVLSEQGHFLRDAKGATLIAKVDHGALGRFAKAVDVLYQPIRLDEHDLAKLNLSQPSSQLHASHASVRLQVWLDQGYWLIVPLLLIAAVGARRGWIFALALLMLEPKPVYAFSFTDLWLRPDQQGAHALQQHQPLKAAERFEDPMWQGYALFKAGLYQQAAERFALFDTAWGHYNRATALAAADALEDALAAFAKALELDPNLEPAKLNKALVEQALKARNAQEAPVQAPSATPAPSPSQGNQSALESPDNTSSQAGAEAEQASAVSAEEGSPTKALAQSSTQNRPATEQAQSLEQWLRQVPDNPGELLQRKFLLELEQRQGDTP